MASVLAVQEISMSPPSRGAWIEISSFDSAIGEAGQSPPSRGAWIEITWCMAGEDVTDVAPLAGGVD